ncbi:conjugal transfer protein TraJ [Telmatospirillum sp. J64-1]|uniref:plasmid mobilization protein n=1 Tax=Telmatospirillum sp. J64-1 TaxID=2502183 RepID=UPI00115E2AA1|nr:conjugal transfer protein TraJ [Telmatospirillum sp. J64-1]
MPSDRHQVKTYLDDKEKQRLEELADQVKLKHSELIRRLIMGYRLPNAGDLAAYQGIRDLMKVNADLARLGNLFKLALDEAPPEELIAKLDAIADEIAETQRELKACARTIHGTVKRIRA